MTRKLHMGQTIAECDCPTPLECRGEGECWTEKMPVKPVTDLYAENAKLREALEELLAAMHPEAGEIDRKLAVKDARDTLKELDDD